MSKKETLLFPKILVVDSTKRDEISLALLIEGTKAQSETYSLRAQDLPTTIETFLESHICPIETLKALAVLRQPESLTGTRMGIAVVNTLAWLYSLPIIEVDTSDFTDALQQLASGADLAAVKQTLPIS